jgi:cell division protein FtsB
MITAQNAIVGRVFSYGTRRPPKFCRQVKPLVDDRVEVQKEDGSIVRLHLSNLFSVSEGERDAFLAKLGHLSAVHVANSGLEGKEEKQVNQGKEEKEEQFSVLSTSPPTSTSASSSSSNPFVIQGKATLEDKRKRALFIKRLPTARSVLIFHQVVGKNGRAVLDALRKAQEQGTSHLEALQAMNRRLRQAYADAHIEGVPLLLPDVSHPATFYDGDGECEEGRLFREGEVLDLTLLERLLVEKLTQLSLIHHSITDRASKDERFHNAPDTSEEFYAGYRRKYSLAGAVSSSATAVASSSSSSSSSSSASRSSLFDGCRSGGVPLAIRPVAAARLSSLPASSSASPSSAASFPPPRSFTVAAAAASPPPAASALSLPLSATGHESVARPSMPAVVGPVASAAPSAAPPAVPHQADAAPAAPGVPEGFIPVSLLPVIMDMVAQAVDRNDERRAKKARTS